MSAALLLYSFYLISADAKFLVAEVAKLAFNLGSLQFYEWLVIGTAVFLAGRAVWYDSTLLVGLENLLMLVPFILVSQAALIDVHLVWGLCGVAALLAAGRAGLLKRYIPMLNLPPRLLGVGMVLLVVNAALPAIYRVLHESKFGTKPDWGAAFETNQYAWWVLLPALCALSQLVPLSRRPGAQWPERGWLPMGLFGLWLLGTGVHLYCLGYVYDFSLRKDLIAPTVWVLLWALAIRTAQFVPDLNRVWRGALMGLPLVATLLAGDQPGKEVFLILTVVNVAAYGYLYYRREGVIALHLLLLSLVALIGGMPEEWGRRLATEFSREGFIAGAGALYVLVCVAWSRNAKLGFFGGLIAAMGTGVAVNGPDAPYWAVDIGLTFFLLHSLRWNDTTEAGAKAVRWMTALAWLGHSILWMQMRDASGKACLVAVIVLACFFAYRLLQGRWGHIVIAAAAGLVLLASPVRYGAGQLNAAPAGVLALMGSFLLFGLGTLAAITKGHWAHGAKKAES
jgi:hypothetical protein